MFFKTLLEAIANAAIGLVFEDATIEFSIRDYRYAYSRVFRKRHYRVPILVCFMNATKTNTTIGSFFCSELSRLCPHQMKG